LVATQLINLLPDTRIPKIVLHLIIESGAAIGDIILMNDCGSGVAFTGPTGTSLAYIGAAPGISPSTIGNVESNQGLILSSQQQLNQLAGNVYAYRNSKYPNASFQLKGNYRNLDIAPLENVPITIDTNDTVRGIQLTAEPFHIQSIDWRYDSTDGYLYVSSIALSQLTNGKIGDTINIPVIWIDFSFIIYHIIYFIVVSYINFSLYNN